MNNTELRTFGMYGSVNKSGAAAAASGRFYAIQILNDTVFSLLTDSLASGDAITSLTIPAGITLFGNFTAFTLTSGAVRAYKALPGA